MAQISDFIAVQLTSPALNELSDHRHNPLPKRYKNSDSNLGFALDILIDIYVKYILRPGAQKDLLYIFLTKNSPSLEPFWLIGGNRGAKK